MSCKNAALGFAIGLGIGTAIGLLFAPKPGYETRQLLKAKSADAVKKVQSNLKWTLMTPRERYIYLWNRGGSLRNWRDSREAVNSID
jgi:gas vesicle protein